MSAVRRPSSLCSSNANPSLPMLFPPFLLLLLVPLAQGGTWLSFNQNNGGIDGGLIGVPRGEYSADAMRSGGQLAVREGEQLLGLLRMCRQKSLKRSQHNLEGLCSALFQMAKEQRRRKRRDILGRERHQNEMATKRPFLPIGEDEEQWLWW
ncbi:hypothetical protein niasHT_004958 [Heterodera trifolii]|uniref:Uncharacterized protein n=1 Tax=Heterodera trifolii TaxID=157864 RepID=A0ABD2M4L6_9BILA